MDSRSAPPGIALGEAGGVGRLAQAIRRARSRTGGITGNERLTGAMAAILLVMLAAEGVTIAFLGQLLPAHIVIGIALIPPVMLKLASTGYRFARYYTGNPTYRAKGAPHILLRASAPLTILLTLAVLGTGVALLLQGSGGQLLFWHKLSFFVWLGFMGIHVLGHILPVPKLASPDWRRTGPEAAVAGSSLRIVLVAVTVVAGFALGAASLMLAGSWLG